jgi:hypothetical protein
MNLNLIKMESTNDSSSDTEKLENKFTFMKYVFSKTAEKIRTNVMKHFSPPNLKRAKLLLEVVKTQKPMLFKDTTTVKLPDGHFPLASILVIPIVVSLETVGLVGLANGKYKENDGKILSDVFSQSWFYLLQESLSRMELKFNEGKNNFDKKDY